jgi:hypothetical protein
MLRAADRLGRKWRAMASGIVERSKREMLTAGNLRAAGALVAAVGVGALAGRWIARPKAVEELRKMLQAETKSIREEGERQANALLDQNRRISELDSKLDSKTSAIEGEVKLSLRRAVSKAGLEREAIEASVNRASTELDGRMRAIEGALADVRADVRTADDMARRAIDKSDPLEGRVNRAQSELDERMSALHGTLADAHAEARKAAARADFAYDTVKGWGDELAELRRAFAQDMESAARAHTELNSLVAGSLLEQDTKVDRGINTAQLTLKEAQDARAVYEGRIARLESAVHAIIEIKREDINSDDPQLFGASAPLATTLVVALSAVNPKARPAIARKMAEVLIGQAALGAAHEPRPRARPLYTE